MIDRVYSTTKTILVYVLLVFLGFFVFTIIKILFTLVFMALINFDIIEFETYNNYKAIMVLLSVILAIYLTPKINDLKSLKAKIIVGVLVVILGAIGALYISMSNHIAKKNTESFTNSSVNNYKSQPDALAGNFEDGLKAYDDGEYKKAATLWQKAADQGNASAQYNLGVMYKNGQGVKQDYFKAKELYQKAADQGSAGAQLNLGVMYDEGYGVKQDYFKAAALYQKAADQGIAEAQYNLGIMYFKELKGKTK